MYLTAPSYGFIAALIAALLPVCSTVRGQPATVQSATPEMRCLLEAYPDQLERATATGLVFKDGTVMAWDNGVEPTGYEDRLNHADLKDQMSQPYRTGVLKDPPGLDWDPGRIRHEPFFDKMYGSTEKQVRSRLVKVRWLPDLTNRRARVTTVNGVHRQLEKVSADLQKLPKRFHKYLQKPSTFNFRKIRKTNRKSMHSYGIAIDIGVEYSDFWRWVKPGKENTLPYRNRIPPEIVEVFERHGFIWGGRWYHFDTMHFEYRPELLHPLCSQGNR